MGQAKWQHLYGPVPSRRLGRSLGVDLVPHNICSFDCIYCQLGRTTNKTLERRPYVDAGEILGELRRWVKQDGQADYITFSGLGEPPLTSWQTRWQRSVWSRRGSYSPANREVVRTDEHA